MSEIFLKIVNMSISASWLVLAVLLLRFVLKKAPKWVNVLLWGIVAVRLMLPFSLESIFSLIPSGETVPMEIMMSPAPSIHTGITAFNTAVNPIISESLAPAAGASMNPLQLWIPVLALTWMAGVAVMLIWAAVSYLRLRKKVATAVLLRENIYQSEAVSSPFVLGILKPKIYLPFSMEGPSADLVIAHERAHISRRDHWWKPFGFLLLTLHWFNPLIWLAYALLCRDIEFACDEKVIRELDEAQRADYSEALLSCCVDRRQIAACPVAFGETGVKGRIKSVLSYKKPALWLIIAALVLCGVLCVCFLTDPINTAVRNPYVQEYIPGQEGIVGNVDKEKYESISEDFAIGADQYGRAVFKDPYRAFDTFETLYAEAIDLIREAHNLPPFSKNNYDLYKTYGWQTDGENTGFVSNFLDLYENSFTKEIPPAFSFPPTAETLKPLTREDVIRLSQKGEELTWGDFEEYASYETGSGLYIQVYEIDEMFSLSIGGSSPEMNKRPMYFYLRANDGTDEQIDIRNGGVEEFFAYHEHNPIVMHCSGGWLCSPIGHHEETFEKMLELGGIPKNAAVNSIQTLPVVKITSTAQLQQFREEMSPYMDEDHTYSDVYSLKEAFETYDELFFSSNTLFLVYISEEKTSHRHTVEYIQKSEGLLSIGIQVTEPDSGDEAMEGWILSIAVPADQLKDVTEYEVRVSSTLFPDRGTANANPIRSYVFTESEDIIKPSVTLFDNGMFSFTFSGISSYLGMGTYEIENDRLTLHTDDGRFTYVFDMVEDLLEFDAAASSDMLWFSKLYDGAILE